jgi:FKBP-type peptidyl-prolyl cis-trans isomerase FklB
VGEPAYSVEELQAAMQAFQQKMMAEQQARHELQAAENVAAGEAFLTENAAREGIETTESGLQFEVLEPGTGDSPTAEDAVQVHYKGTLIDGTVFDSSYERGQPAEFPVGGVIAGWTEALQLMNCGSKWRLYVPSELAYGEQGVGSIPPHSVLVFDIELLEVL